MFNRLVACIILITLLVFLASVVMFPTSPRFFERKPLTPYTLTPPPFPDISVAQKISLASGQELSYRVHYGAEIVPSTVGPVLLSYFEYQVPSPVRKYVSTRGWASPRPLVFSWNGGPGDSSYLSHLGGFGPWRARYSIPSRNHVGRIRERLRPDFRSGNKSDVKTGLGFRSELDTHPPFYLDPNPHTLLSSCDLVYVDPPSTGLSGGGPECWEDGTDAAITAHFIYQYLARTANLNRPKY